MLFRSPWPRCTLPLHLRHKHSNQVGTNKHCCPQVIFLQRRQTLVTTMTSASGRRSVSTMSSKQADNLSDLHSPQTNTFLPLAQCWVGSNASSSCRCHTLHAAMAARRQPYALQPGSPQKKHSSGNRALCAIAWFAGMLPPCHSSPCSGPSSGSCIVFETTLLTACLLVMPTPLSGLEPASLTSLCHWWCANSLVEVPCARRSAATTHLGHPQ